MPGHHSADPASFATASLRRRRGFTIAEVTLALIVFAMMTVLFAAVFPMAVRGAHYSSNYAQAAMLAQHKLDQLRSAGYKRLSVPTGDNSLASLNVIDSPQPAGYPIVNGGVSTYSITSADGMLQSGAARGYFPDGSIGTVTIQDYATFNPSAGVPAGTLAYVTVSIAWSGAGIAASSYKVSTIIAKAAQP